MPNFSNSQVFHELVEQIQYAIGILGSSREALVESKVGRDFNGKPPRPVIMHAISRGLTEIDMPGVDQKKFMRGIISLCLFFLEEEEVNLALKIKQELGGKDDD